MDVREKLIEICFREFCDLAGDSPCGCDGCPYGKYSSENGECYEEYKNDKFVKMEKTGVTVQEWISVTDRLPDKDGCYIVTACDEGCSCGDGIWYDTVVIEAEHYKGEWSWNENGTEYDITDLVTHWMPMPNLPEDGGANHA